MKTSIQKLLVDTKALPRRWDSPFSAGGVFAAQLDRLLPEDPETCIIVAVNFRLDWPPRKTKAVWLALVAAFAAHDVPLPVSERTFYRRVAAEREYGRVRHATRRGYPT